MKAETNNLSCGRKDDLISFLYEELNSEEQHQFVQHMQKCADCQTELEGFANVRHEVVAWRDATVGAMTPVAMQPAMVAADRKRSAIAALREFFDLSPLWMKASVALATVLFCVLAVLVVAGVGSKPEQVVVKAPERSAITAQEINAQVERRVKEELEKRKPVETSVQVSSNQSRHAPAPSVSNRRNTQVAVAAAPRAGSRPLSKLERRELAADLGLLTDTEDGELVLIGDRINQ